MHKPRSIKDLLTENGKRLASLTARSRARSAVLDRVCATLPASLAPHVVSAGIEARRLTVGVDSAVWAARLRYRGDALRTAVATAGQPVDSVRIKVVPPRPRA